MLAYLGWVIAAFLGGFLLADLIRRGRRSLRRQFAKIEVYRGLTYGQVLCAVGREPGRISQRRDGVVLRTWYEPGYSITLAFDRNDLCLGVEDERD